MSEMTHNADQACGNCTHYRPAITIGPNGYSVGRCHHPDVVTWFETESDAGHFCQRWQRGEGS
jgi:hypothetical protein